VFSQSLFPVLRPGLENGEWGRREKRGPADHSGAVRKTEAAEERLRKLLTRGFGPVLY